MAFPNINIEVGNGALGLTVPTNDALAGMVLQGPAPSGLALGVPQLITSLVDAENLGIDANYDSANTLGAHKAIREFYAGAGNGAQLWIMVVSQAVDMETIMDVAEQDYAVKLLNAAAGGIRLLTVVRNPAAAYTPTLADGIDSDVAAAITNAQALATQYVSEYKPLRIILPAYAYNNTPGDLPNLRTRSDNRVAVLLGDSVSGINAGVGILLGRLADIPVQRNIGRVKSGSLPIVDGYIGTSTVESIGAAVEIISEKGFVTLRRHIGLAGYYFADDPTATSATDDYNSIARGRVIDKVIYIAYVTYLNELLDEIDIDPVTGQIRTAQAKYYQAIAESAINTAMTANEEISGVEVEVDPNQNVLSTGKLCVKLRVTPVGYARVIEVDLGFINNAL
ncbi:MAG: DUF2586 family protein [Bacteroidota bacterium]